MSQQESYSKELIKYLKASLLLQLRNIDEQGTNGTTKPEVLLNQAGFSIKEIAELLGKNYEAVQKAISRAKPKEQK